MSLSEKQRNEILNWILNNVRSHPNDIASLAQSKYHLSRITINKYLQKLITEKKILTEGNTRNRTYILLPLAVFEKSYEITQNLAEDRVWRNDILPLLTGQNENILRICEYGFSEIFNNAIDHSEGKTITAKIELFPDQVAMLIRDDGIGIFNKIAKECQLEDPYTAILELSKGKLTTQPESHTGEGIFFTSRMFDRFSILSHKLTFGSAERVDILLEDDAELEGTLVSMEISPSSTRTTQQVFDEYSEVDRGFDKTVVPVSLVKYGNENLVSRSQAKRMLNRLEKFKVVMLDFEGIDEIGRAFADETFRVFANAHPGMKLIPINITDSIKKLINEIVENNDKGK